MLVMLKQLITRAREKKFDEINRQTQFNIEIDIIDAQFISANENQSNDIDDEFVFKKLRIDVDFELTYDDIIYYMNIDVRRSCIFMTTKRKIFQLAHDENQHVDVYRCYDRIINSIYVSRLSRKIRQYIEHCFSCQLIQIKRHRLYDKLMSIISPPHSFHIIAMNFIVALSGEFDVFLTITCKFFRRVALISNKIIYNVNQ